MRRPIKKSALILASIVSILAVGLVIGVNAYTQRLIPMLKTDYPSFVAQDFVHRDAEGLPITQFNFSGKLSLVLIPSLNCQPSCPEVENFLTAFETWKSQYMRSKNEKNNLLQLFVATSLDSTKPHSAADWTHLMIDQDDKVFGRIDFEPTTTQVAILDDDAKVIDVLPISSPQVIERRLSQTYSRVAMYKFLSDVPMFRRY